MANYNRNPPAEKPWTKTNTRTANTIPGSFVCASVLSFLYEIHIVRGLVWRCVDTSVRAASRSDEIVRLWVFVWRQRKQICGPQQRKTQTAVVRLEETPSTQSYVVNLQNRKGALIRIFLIVHSPAEKYQNKINWCQRTSEQTFKYFVLVKVPHFPSSTSRCGQKIPDEMGGAHSKREMTYYNPRAGLCLIGFSICTGNSLEIYPTVNTELRRLFSRRVLSIQHVHPQPPTSQTRTQTVAAQAVKTPLTWSAMGWLRLVGCSN